MQDRREALTVKYPLANQVVVVVVVVVVVFWPSGLY